MATSKLTTWWTALIGALVALLAFLGLAGPATAATASVPQHDATYNRSEPATSVAPTVHWALPAASALPPTMKQRIRAEAHGSSPSSRHRADTPDTADNQAGGDNTADEPEDPDGADTPSP
ncbi:DUF6344 domain-containing protein [Streptomyces sp. NPDC001691]|uniref:DUF6344 domain-containing protein n=1 Tax=unclassified Streptomyces TaxID=2593676 RepID=UPI000DEB60DE|nr:DUF6344 domain-containing protein [Streptomyces sp. SDr-06]RCH66423.1 hypothetical protein DT019_22280 [Streptomyces sp. SDr-06]